MGPIQISRTEPLGFLKHKEFIFTHINLSGLKTLYQHHILISIWELRQKLLTIRPNTYRKNKYGILHQVQVRAMP